METGWYRIVADIVSTSVYRDHRAAWSAYETICRQVDRKPGDDRPYLIGGRTRQALRNVDPAGVTNRIANREVSGDGWRLMVERPAGQPVIAVEPVD